MLIKRQLENVINRLIQKYPIIALTGPRQSGKTTLLKNILTDYRYVSLENIDERSFANEDPKGFLKKYNTHVIFDEVQRAPSLFSYMQTKVDESSEMGQFVLSGSQNFHLIKSITQSLAGRVALLKLLPFDFDELKTAELLENNWKSLILKGFYPPIFDRNLDYSFFYSNYIQTYIERDVAELTKVHSFKQFNNFIGLCAARTGQLLNISNLAKSCGISQPTAKAWLSILESSYIIFLLPPYFENFNKRIVKSPKLYFYDTGLVSFLLGLRHESDLVNQTLTGSLFENLIIANIFKTNYHKNLLKSYWFWRDSKGNEIDLLSKSGNNFDIFEVKSTETVLPKLFKGMKYFEEITNGKINNKTLIYGGDENYKMSGYKISSWNNI